jgi:hypothetical protein
MRTILESYRKPILAIFGVVLMVVFILPPTLKSGFDARNNPVIGHIGSDEVHAAENATAEKDWEIVTRTVVLHTSMPDRPWVPVVAGLLSGQAIDEINAHRESFLLLVKEAEKRGVTVTEAELDNLLNDPQLAVADPHLNRYVAFSDLTNLDEADRIRAAIGRLMLVVNSYQGAQDAIKISQPVRRQLVAHNFQTADISVVDVPAALFTPAAPTTQALDAQFKKYANVNPEDEAASPYGYGYRFPDRVKLQSIELPVAAVRAAAERTRSKDEYEWDRDAYKYYLANQSEFPTTAPAATTAPSRQPTTRPFAQAKADARQAVLATDIDKLTQRILDRLTSQIASDYNAYRSALKTGGANAKLPNSSVGVPYNSYEYLQRVAAQAQKDFGVLPSVNGYDKDFLSIRDLMNLPGIGQTEIEGQPFAVYVMTHAAPLTSEKDEARTLSLFEPSPTVHDPLGNAFLFRLSDAQAAHAPASIQEVAAAVDQDVRAASTFQQAKKVADQLLAQAQQSGKTLKSAASAAGRTLTPITGVRFNDATALLPLHLSGPVAARSFLRQTFELMSSASKNNPHPVGIIELPRDGRALVVQIDNVHSDLTPDDLRILEAQAGFQAARQFATPLQADWFSYDNIAARLNYQPTAANDRNNPTPANPNTPPAGQPLL